ncbi:hypothetical protein WICPIJ_009218 [Wickerhamomyces pijperi]|uniref:Uncharacterized protein n=1 Tax=Wickerhamomyces pijperi TaxID=599730 RepID=A0A9P8TEH4_WICPI|nr:hypothetical protein WICPIJ_009218 [Wickerhamomyces pijperi]
MIGSEYYSIVIDLESYPSTNQPNSSWLNKVIERNDIFTPFPANKLNFKEAIVPDTKESSHCVHSNTEKDYRTGRIMISLNDNHHISLSDPLKAHYVGYGVVRLFREFVNKSKSPDHKEENGTQESHDEYEFGDSEKEVHLDDETTVSIVAIPSYFTPTDVLGFLGADYVNSLSHIRIINSSNINRLVVLLKFRNRETARAFHEEFNGKDFNNMEAQTCHVVFIKSVIFRPLNHSSTSSTIPYLLEDPFTSLVRKSDLRRSSLGDSESIIKELPTCPVCLERMDSETSGLLTISCQHTFHSSCLTKWKDDTCPVCRYSTFRNNSDLRKENLEDSKCSKCDNTMNLWICLICGNVGCGRYDSKHAIEHYEETNHCFAMDIESQRVWDYAGDNYVHRLLQNESDGKLVEVSDNAFDCHSLVTVSSGKSNKTSELQREEYTEILLSQLESQREYYESRLAEAAQLYGNRTEERDHDHEQSSAPRQTGDSQQSETYKKELKKLKPLVKKLERSYEEEKMLSENLAKNLEQLKLENNKLKEEREDLSSQVTDLMFYLESQEKFKDASDDVKNGTILVQEPSVSSTRNNKKNKKGRSK